MYFYDKTTNAPLFKYEPYSSQTMEILTHRMPTGLTGRTVMESQRIRNVESLDLFNGKPPFDKYTLFQDSLRRQKEEQGIYLLSEPVKNNDTEKTPEPADENKAILESEVITQLRPVMPDPSSFAINNLENEHKRFSVDDGQQKESESKDERMFSAYFKRDILSFQKAKKKRITPKDELQKIIAECKERRVYHNSPVPLRKNRKNFQNFDKRSQSGLGNWAKRTLVHLRE